MNQTAPPVAMLGFGQVRHTRLRPVRHAFDYPTYFLMLPLRSMQANGNGYLARNRRAPLSFYDADHGDGRSPQAGGALAWLDDILHGEGITDATGEVWLHTYPRVWGYTFKPVSFWYCHQSDGGLRAVVVEVNNTFGERHCYLLDRPRFGQELRSTKVFHVSPFCPVEGSYRFRFLRSADQERTVARIDYDDALGPLIATSVSGQLRPLDAHSLRHALWRYPLMTFGVVARIHLQAFKLWLRRVPLMPKPAAPRVFLSR